MRNRLAADRQLAVSKYPTDIDTDEIAGAEITRANPLAVLGPTYLEYLEVSVKAHDGFHRHQKRFALSLLHDVLAQKESWAGLRRNKMKAEFLCATV